ncbi:RDD family protein [Stenoxybacter acetivorans]|uniref:RDD family protein n=1 Tax=Stenoxybacter acetivorans TaxID=422441 RepID=UPI00056A66AC|nr:RDD family protein [Stenoxybacter acetivorans]
MNSKTSALSNEAIEVELASPGQRLWAILLNGLCYMLVFFLSLSFLAVVKTISPNISEALFDLLVKSSLNIFSLLLGVWQIIWMSKYGQSIGKNIVGIKVIKLDGENPGFVGTVLMREGAYYLILGMIAYIIGSLISTPETAGGTINNLAFFACAIMVFIKSNMRRTLQDYLAKTIVIKVPK